MPIWYSSFKLQLIVVSFCALAGGCSDRTDAGGPAKPPNRQKTRSLQLGESGSILGRVTWTSALPKIAKFEVQRSLSFFPCWQPETSPRFFPNPNAPQIDPSHRGITEAVVFLRGVEPESSCAWNHKPVKVAVRDYRISVFQGTKKHRTGFVRPGDAVKLVSRAKRFHILRARQDAYFSLTLPYPFQPRQRRLRKPGLVELSDGAGYYWLRGYIFVCNHPYYTRTDKRGRFTLRQIPTGKYELVAWLPNWLPAGHDRDPDQRNIMRLRYLAPVERIATVHVQANQQTKVEFTFALHHFSR